ncbi:hypothetical protein GCM10022281_04960 [Sphingomonas rosea]|uniref:Uncharacterized protein n=1 Tax=Sphingomonas rosea TaxID=335605 RepID=A0ABP7TP04_9SPHN
MSDFDPLRTFGRNAKLARMRISDLRMGDVYRHKESAAGNILAQVGEGGDVGFFRAQSTTSLAEQQPLFRLVMNQPDFRRHWQRQGSFPAHESMRHLAWYGDADIGSEVRYRVRLDNIEMRTEVDDMAFERLERLAVWETAHVLERLTRLIPSP